VVKRFYFSFENGQPCGSSEKETGVDLFYLYIVIFVKEVKIP